MGDGGAVTQSGGLATIGAITFGGATAGMPGGTYNLNGGTLNVASISAGANATTKVFNLGGGTFQLGPSGGVSSYPMTLVTATNSTIDTEANAGTLSGVISGGGSYTKVGAGTLTIAANDTYTGTLTLSQGQLNVNNGGTFGSYGILTINGGTIDNTSGASISPFCPTQTWNGSFTYGGSNSLLFGSGAIALNNNVTITCNGTGSLTENSTITGGTYGLTKNGPGTLLMGGNSSHYGDTILNAGWLQLRASDPFGSTNGTLWLNGGTLSGYNATAEDVDWNNVNITGNVAIGLGTGGTGTAGTTFGGVVFNSTSGSVTIINTVNPSIYTGSGQYPDWWSIWSVFRSHAVPRLQR